MASDPLQLMIWGRRLKAWSGATPECSDSELTDAFTGDPILISGFGISVVAEHVGQFQGIDGNPKA